LRKKNKVFFAGVFGGAERAVQDYQKGFTAEPGRSDNKWGLLPGSARGISGDKRRTQVQAAQDSVRR
jgi:hypothetical protein